MKKKLLFVFVATALWSCGDEKKEGDESGKEDAKTEASKDEGDETDGHDHSGHDHDHDHAHDHGHNHATWEGEEAFHEHMEVCFHSMEDGNMEPVMAQARDMANAASTWANSDIPEELNQEGVQDLLDQLSAEANNLADAVESGDDESVIGEKLDQLHTLFHEVMETAGHSHHHGHNHDHGHEH